MLVAAVDLLWLRPKKVGGTEFYIRNLLDGFLRLEEPFHLYLMVSKDNRETFRHYTEDDRFELLETEVVSANIAGRFVGLFLPESFPPKKRNPQMFYTGILPPTV